MTLINTGIPDAEEQSNKRSISYYTNLSSFEVHLVHLSNQRRQPTTGRATLCFQAPRGRKGRSLSPLLTDLSTRVFSFEEDDDICEEDRGAPDPEGLSWPLTSFGESPCLQLICSTSQTVCCPRNVRRTGCSPVPWERDFTVLQDA